MGSAVSAVPVAADGSVRITLVDEDHALAGARLYQELQRPYDGPELAWHDGVWSAELPARGALRIEYLLSVRYPDGRVATGPDPANPARAPGPFGEKSVIELPGYQPPAWLHETPPTLSTHASRDVIFPSRKLGRDVRVALWTSSGAAADDCLPLLVAHDGPEYAELSQLLAYLDVATAAGRLPAMHVALLAPGDRDQEYSASAMYADALAFELLPDVLAEVAVPATDQARVGMGASLGALAMLHAHRRRPSLFGGLFLQSGSYFQRRTDPHEVSFRRFTRINRFVAGVLGDPGPAPKPITVRLSCGSVEENLDNNRALAGALATQGYTVTLGRVADGHNWICWRDAFDTHLGLLLNGLWGSL
jgi:enterochelin esterase-like enzyme